MSAFAAIGVGLSLIGANKQARGLKKTGERAKQRAIEQDVFNESAAMQAMAAGQANAFEETRQSELMASRAVAVAAAGGSVNDIGHLIADIHGEGAYRASLVLREAEQYAESLRFEGEQGIKYAGDQNESYKAQASAVKMNAFASLFSFM